MKISIIGAGNIAWHLAKALEQADMDIIEVYSRDRRKAKSITQELYQSDATNSLNFKDSEAELFVMAVSDNAIEEVAAQIELPEESILIHTSGSVPLEVLEITKKMNPDCILGVFYPLMTFTKGKNVAFRTVPICIEGDTSETTHILSKIAKKVSNEVYEVNSQDRKVLHLAAVFACNFTNHLFALSKEILNEEGLNFEILKPLISETLNKGMAAKHPAEVQTGPAVRRDSNTIETHRQLIKDDEDLLKVYDTLTESIQDWHK
ncbi:Predicted oxidoreductase, contains short-chain dehydrogenase (SDR) and DUF2520 domains [Spirosomataceae bacterium TFI 002]|nr:Predicted oxidoreductase, contains short-chain dehydrogenase (SDR) and DUF2520 domains [Spirosomataceae bacterium TFI 002]